MPSVSIFTSICLERRSYSEAAMVSLTCSHALLSLLQLCEQLEVSGHLCDCHDAGLSLQVENSGRGMPSCNLMGLVRLREVSGVTTEGCWS